MPKKDINLSIFNTVLNKAVLQKGKKSAILNNHCKCPLTRVRKFLNFKQKYGK